MTIFRLTPNDDSDSRVEVNRSLIDGPTVTFVNIRQGDESAAAWLTADETRAVIAALQATLPAEEAPAFPYPSGDVTVLGPECFADAAGDVISWKGENYRCEVPCELGMADPDRHKVTTAAELDALPVGARVVDNEGDIWTREADGRCWRLGVGEVVRPSKALAVFLPGTLLNPEMLDEELPPLSDYDIAEEPTTVGTVRLYLRLFLGDRDITYALANPIADALEG